MTVVIIDNNDSFTYNLAESFAVLGQRSEVLRNDASLRQIARRAPTHLVFSPGPGNVDDSCGNCFDVMRRYLGMRPMLGVCLGHQALGKFFGATVRRAGRVAHGRVSGIRRTLSCPVLHRLPRSFPAMRYHSLVIAPDSVPACLQVTCVSEDDDEIMGLRHRDLAVFGLQFHPESMGTPTGRRMLGNFLSAQ